MVGGRDGQGYRSGVSHTAPAESSSLGSHVLTAEIWLPRPRAEAFRFFGNAANLEAITPPWVRFEILTPQPIVMAPGTLIDYRLRIHGLPLRWRTEIKVWEPPFRFMDEQLRGPYRLWRHWHTFEEQEGGTLCRDRVEYRVPGGALVNWLFVRHDVARIFRHRQRRLAELFPGTGDRVAKVSPAATGF